MRETVLALREHLPMVTKDLGRERLKVEDHAKGDCLAEFEVSHESRIRD